MTRHCWRFNVGVAFVVLAGVAFAAGMVAPAGQGPLVDFLAIRPLAMERSISVHSERRGPAGSGAKVAIVSGLRHIDIGVDFGVVGTDVEVSWDMSAAKLTAGGNVFGVGIQRKDPENAIDGREVVLFDVNCSTREVRVLHREPLGLHANGRTPIGAALPDIWRVGAWPERDEVFMLATSSEPGHPPKEEIWTLRLPRGGEQRCEVVKRRLDAGPEGWSCSHAEAIPGTRAVVLSLSRVVPPPRLAMQSMVAVYNAEGKELWRSKASTIPITAPEGGARPLLPPLKRPIATAFITGWCEVIVPAADADGRPAMKGAIRLRIGPDGEGATETPL